MTQLAIETHELAEPSFSVGKSLKEAAGGTSQSQHAHDVKLAHANRVAMVGQLSASLAHEVAQPITGVLTSAQIALRLLNAQQDNLEEIRQALGRVGRDGKRAADIIGSIRALMRKAPRSTGPLDVKKVIVEALSA